MAMDLYTTLFLPLKLISLTILFFIIAEKTGLTTNRQQHIAKLEAAAVARSRSSSRSSHRSSSSSSSSRSVRGRRLRAESTSTTASGSTAATATSTSTSTSPPVSLPTATATVKEDSTTPSLLPYQIPSTRHSHERKVRTSDSSKTKKLRTRPKLLEIPIEKMEAMASAAKVGGVRFPRTPTMATFSRN